jgi:alkanesulfonate monooxygenase SsuD/methylene tetrahydromethanopterin reductase-like flavin-dependent oxidoreductase (luciferase family)
MAEDTQFGVLLPTREMFGSPGSWDVDRVLRYAVEAEDLGYASVWAGDALRLERLEPLVTLGAVAAITRRVQLGTAAMVPALREPLIAMQAVTSLDVLSCGRLVVAVGAGFPGASKTQFAAAGAEYATRYTRLDDIVGFWRKLWRDPSTVNFDGRQLHFSELPRMLPPVQAGGPPVWFAGATPKALQRAGAYFDGWMPYPPSVDDYSAGLATVRAAAEAAGRDPSTITPSLYATVLVEDRPALARAQLEAFCQAFYELPLEYIETLQLMVAGPAGYVRQRLDEYSKAGARHIVLRIASLNHDDQLARVAEALGIRKSGPDRTVDTLAARYVALWNDPDPARRAETLRELWTPRGAQLLQPPSEMIESAQRIGFSLDILEARGYEALETRVSRAYAEFVAPGKFEFRQRDAAKRVENVVKFRWEMVERLSGAVAAIGLEVLVLDGDDRIVTDYQFIET